MYKIYVEQRIDGEIVSGWMNKYELDGDRDNASTYTLAQAGEQISSLEYEGVELIKCEILPA